MSNLGLPRPGEWTICAVYDVLLRLLQLSMWSCHSCASSLKHERRSDRLADYSSETELCASLLGVVIST